MANKISKHVTFKIDNASATITDISAWLNSASLNGLQEVLDDTGFGVEERTKLNGLASASIPLNGFVNSTTAGIFGPLVGNYTSLTKTFGYYDGYKWHTGEAYVENPSFSGNVGELETWSCTLQVSGAVLSTAVAPT